MKAEFKDGSLVIDCQEFVESMPPATRAELCKYLVADEVLFKAVADYITTGLYHDDWWGSPDVTELRERFVPLMPEAARELVRDLVQQRDRHKTDAEDWRNAYWKLWHAWPDHMQRERPECAPPFVPVWKPSEAVAEEMIAMKGAE